jgi:hypothetical protein
LAERSRKPGTGVIHGGERGLFLKYLDDLEHERALEAQLKGGKYEPIVKDEFRWAAWAAPKNKQGEFDHDKALTGDDLIDFVNRELFTLASFAIQTSTRMERSMIRISHF